MEPQSLQAQECQTQGPRPPVPALSAQGPSHLPGQLRSAPQAGSVGTPQLGGM